MQQNLHHLATNSSIGHHKETSRFYPHSASTSSPSVRLLGLCTGLLAATAITSVDSLIALLPVVVQTVRAAFRIGAHVANVGERLEIRSDTYERWSIVFAMADVQSAEALNKFYQEYVRIALHFELLRS